MQQGTDSDQCTILRETVDMYSNIQYNEGSTDACLDCFSGKVIQLLERFEYIEEQYDRYIGFNNRMGSNECS